MHLSKLEKEMGYQFNNRELLTQALTHRSYNAKNNERLEYLGDSILGYIIAEKLYHLFPQAVEGELTRMRASLVQQSALADLARQIKINEYLILGSGELKSGGFNRDSIISDTLEALIAAIYLDNGLQPTKEFVYRLYDSLLATISPALIKDNKTQLQELLQKISEPLPTYTLLSQSGEAHKPTFYVACILDDQTKFQAEAKNIKIAEQKAAEKALKFIQEKMRNTHQ